MAENLENSFLKFHYVNVIHKIHNIRCQLKCLKKTTIFYQNGFGIVEIKMYTAIINYVKKNSYKNNYDV